MSEKDMNELIEKFMKVEMLLHRYQAHGMRARGPLGNPHRGQGRVLALLKMQAEITQKELAYLLDMRQQSVSELLAKLEQKGYITRRPSEEDRRTTLIALTEEGRTAAEQADPDESALNRVFGCLSEKEQAQLGEYLDRLAAGMKDEVKDMEMNWKDFAAGWGPGGRGKPGRGGPDRDGGHGGHRGPGGRAVWGAFGHGFPENMPGGERFHPDHTGPMPEGREGFGGWAAGCAEWGGPEGEMPVENDEDE